MSLNTVKDDEMRVGDKVIYQDKAAVIIEIKWGLYCIKFYETRRQIWVTDEKLIRQDI